MPENQDRKDDLSQAILQAVNANIGNSEVLEVIFVIAADNKDTGKPEFTYGSCLTTNKTARKVMLERALGKVK